MLFTLGKVFTVGRWAAGQGSCMEEEPCFRLYIYVLSRSRFCRCAQQVHDDGGA